MKPTLLSVIALSAVVAIPAYAQQANEPFVPGANFMANWDVNEDGTITLEELLERRADVFSAFDGDENGVLDAEEFRMLDEARADAAQRPEAHGNGASAGQGEQLLSNAATDTDGNGEVSKEEFLAASEAWMAFMDRNKDAVVTRDDFGQGRGKGQGQGQGQGKAQNWQGQRQGQQQAMPGQRGQGRGQDRGMGQGRGDMMPGQYSQMGQGRWQDQGMGRGRGDMMPGQHGQMGQGRGGQGRGQGQAAIAFEAFPTQDGGLWIVDARTGHILYCKAVSDSNAAAGFAPVCKEADL